MVLGCLIALSCEERRQLIVLGDAGVDRGGATAPDSIASNDLASGTAETTGPCTPMLEVCNNLDDDCNGTFDDVAPALLQTDLNQCGRCGVVCPTPANALPECADAKCAYSCHLGAVDIDKAAANGCECLITNQSVEVCDGRDNDCNGTTDEGFAFKTDLKNCGKCRQQCAFPFAGASCQDGMCVMGACRDGFYDFDKQADNGCETACRVGNGGVEACDGLDNNCNGLIDEGVMVPQGFQCRNLGVCVDTTPTCADLGGGVKAWACRYGPDYEQPESKGKGCDGKDNDCDGAVDEGFGVGNQCTAGTGACISTGTVACDTADRSKTICTAVLLGQAQEVCNGRDDDCDGQTDELNSASDRTADDKLVYLESHDVTMFAYESSRYDASGTSPGMDSSARPCSVPGKVPWANVTKEEARDRCRQMGVLWRLCTRNEWSAACSTGGKNDYPYGDDYQRATCNGWEYLDRMAMPDVTTIPTGSAAMCLADQSAGAGDELYDMSGNVREWVFSTINPEAFELRGGAYNVSSFENQAPGLQCSARTPAPTAAVRLPSVGFRCCRPGRL
jgi:hypothetical protein